MAKLWRNGEEGEVESGFPWTVSGLGSGYGAESENESERSRDRERISWVRRETGGFWWASKFFCSWLGFVKMEHHQLSL